MKAKIQRVLFLLIVLAGFHTMTAQTVLIVHGTVNNLNNQPIAGKQVTIVVDSVFGPVLPFSYTSVTQTGPNGQYVDTVLLPANAYFAMVLTYVQDCNNIMQYNFSGFQPPTPLPAMNFNICDSAVATNCVAGFQANPSPNSMLVNFTDMSIPSGGSSIVSWFWSFGDSATSTLQNPNHTYAQPGTYYVCLTITDNTSCTNTFCMPVVVSGIPQNTCHAGFNAIPVGGTLGVTFINTSVSTYGPALHNVDYVYSFGDGTSATASTMANLQHTYNAPGVYYVCLTMQVTNVATSTVVCSDTWCDSVLVGSVNPTSYLYGMLTANGAGAGPSLVYLIQHNALLGTLTAVDTTLSIDSAGVTMYYFSNIIPGNYLVKAAMLPSNPSYAVNMPTYHASSLFWNQAGTINVMPNALTQANISYIQGVNPGGPGFIGGLISQGANKGAGDPIEGVQVLLLDANNGDQPVSVVYSDAAGQFGFTNIPYGTYKVYAEMLNKTTVPVVVTIDATTPSTDGIQIVVGSSWISSISKAESFAAGVVGNIHPNPASDACYLDISAERSGIITLEVADLTGKVIRSRKVNLQPGHNRVKVDAETLGGGVYLVTVTAEDGTRATRRLIRN
ncbi:MAG: PKD domain-containing protein [Bacteroidales bacterium]